jgi:hypothetical protein
MFFVSLAVGKPALPHSNDSENATAPSTAEKEDCGQVSHGSWKQHQILFFFFSFIVVLGGIYKGSYSVSTISYLNSPLHSSPLSLLPHSWNNSSMYHFCIYIHAHTFFALFTFLSPSPPSSPSYWCQTFPLGRTCSVLLFFNFAKEKRKRKL